MDPQRPGRQPHEPRRRATDSGAGLFGSLSRGGTHQARPRVVDTRGRGVRSGTARGGVTPGEWAVPPDDDPEFLRRLGEQLRKDRPES
ncbi:hypothetical protein ACFQ9X_03725 [Catenulispora yoronensis]